MVLDIKNAHTLRSLSSNMNRKSFLFSILGVIALPKSEKTIKPLDMKDKHHFNIYLHELAHKLNQVRPNEFYRSI